MSWSMRYSYAREIVRHADEHFGILERLENEIQVRERKDPLSKARRIVKRYSSGRRYKALRGKQGAWPLWESRLEIR